MFLAFESENRDLKLILRQTEKELEDYKMKYKSQETTVQSQVGEFEDKVFISLTKTNKNNTHIS